MNVLISGGAKNGKSLYAQNLAKKMAEEKGLPLYYIATMIPVDDEDYRRIERHCQEREGWGFTTIEKPTSIIEITEEGVFLLDSVTALLANEMFGSGFNPSAGEKISEELKLFAERKENVIFVSDYIYESRFTGQSADTDARDSKTAAGGTDNAGGMDDTGEPDYTEEYVRSLAMIDRSLAEVCSKVIEITAEIPIIHKDFENSKG